MPCGIIKTDLKINILYNCKSPEKTKMIKCDFTEDKIYVFGFL